jgi:hypothetical protein
MQNPAAWAIAKKFAELLIKFKGTDKQNETSLTLDQWNQLVQILSSMPMMMSTMHMTRHAESL